MRIVRVAQRAEDLERATAFHTDLFGHGPSALYDPPGLVFVEVVGEPHVIFSHADHTLGPPGTEE